MALRRPEVRIALIPALIAFVALAATLWLGRWQLDRAEQKRALQAELEAAQHQPPVRLSGTAVSAERLRFRAVEVTGEFDAARQIFLDNKVERGEAGYHVLTPLRIEGSDSFVLVNRGWVARGASYPQPPAVTVPQGRVTVLGFGALPAAHFLELSKDAVQGPVWQNVTFARFHKLTGLRVIPLLIEQSVADSPDLVPVRGVPSAGIAMHQGYAFQWFSLSAAIVVIFLWRSVTWQL